MSNCVRWNITAAADRLVAIDLPVGAVITPEDLALMPTRVIAGVRQWCARHGRVLLALPQGGYCVGHLEQPAIAAQAA